MRKLELKTPADPTLSPITGWTRQHWEEAFFALMKAIVDSASPGGARQRIPGPRSHHGLLADELEGFTRSFILAGPWLSASKEGAYKWGGASIDVGAFYRRGILAGTDPKHPEYWGDIVDLAQHLVEMAALAWGLHLSKHLVWDRFDAREKQQVAAYMFQATKVKYHQNNWLLFNVITNAVLKKLGMPYSQEQIDANLLACDHMYVGDGWYRDGKLNRIDYYNAWGFLYYYLLWAILDGDSKPALAETHQERTRQFARDFRYFFAGDGSAPCFGRSMIYRFGYLSPIALGQYLGCLDISPGEVKTMCNSTMKFFFSQPILTDTGHLSMGFLRPCAEMLEHYSCGGSPYWATKAFNLLMIPPGDPFWSAKEAPLPIQRGDYAQPVPKAGLLLVGDQRTGHVQLINQKSYHDKPEYNDKYTKFAYSSVFSYDARRIYGNSNCDNVLQFSEDGINFRQRWEMENLHCIEGFAASKYPLHEVDPKGTAFTSILVKDDFLINLHLIEATKPLVFKEGGYPLGFDDGIAETASAPNGEAAYKDGKLTFIRNLAGYTRQHKAQGFGDDVSGANVRYRQSVVPVLAHETQKAEKLFLASLVCGRIGKDSLETLMGLVPEFELTGNTARLRFADGERALVQLGSIADLDVTLNGKRLTGPVVMARVSADSTRWLVLLQDGTVESEGRQVTKYDYAILAVYFVFMVSLGWIFRKFSKNSSDYFRGGGNMLWWLVGCTAFMTQKSAWTFTGAASKAYSDGLLVAVLFLGNALGYFIAFLGSAARFRQIRVVTPMEGVRDRYGKVNEQFFTWIWLPIGTLYGGIWLNAVSRFASVVFGWNADMTIIVVGFAVVFVSGIGGSWAIVASDFMQTLVLMAVSAVGAFLAVQAVGDGSFINGATHFVERLPPQHTDWTAVLRPQILVLWIVAALLKQVCTTNNLNDANRFLYSKDSRNARKAALLASILFLVGPLLWFIPPMAAAILYPDLSVLPELRALDNKSEGVYVVMGLRLMPAGMIGLMVASIFAATTSSMEPGLNKNAGIFVMNFYKPILRKNKSEREYLVAGKLASLFFGILVIGAALAFERIKGVGLFNMMMLFSSMVAIPFLMPLIWGVIIKRTPSWAGWSTVLVGLAVSFYTANYLDLDAVRKLVGLATVLTKREKEDALFFTSLFLNVGVATLWFFFTTLFARFNSKELNEREDTFFERMKKPVISNPADTRALDRAQLRTLGVLGIPYGSFVILMAAIPNPVSGRLTFVISGGAILLVAIILYRAAKKIRIVP